MWMIPIWLNGNGPLIAYLKRLQQVEVLMLFSICEDNARLGRHHFSTPEILVRALTAIQQ